MAEAPANRRKFKLVRLLGVGGFGEVYLADMSTPSGFTKTVALKLLKDNIATNDDVAARMHDEARMLGLLRHRSIVQADDLITISGRIAVVMEYIPGCNLSTVLSRARFKHEIPLRVVLHVIAEMADALVAAFSRPSTVTGEPLRVLHRDIKPANVRITPDGEVKILDFGIARAEQMERAAETQEVALGSLYYMAPEVLDGRGASLASDIYALGVTFTESLIRERFGLAGDTDEEHSEKVRRKLSSINFEGNEDHQSRVEALLCSMVDFDPDQRAEGQEVVATAQNLVADLNGPTMVQWAREMLVDMPQGDTEDIGNADLTGTDLFEDPPQPGGIRRDPGDLFDEPTMGVSLSGEPTMILSTNEKSGPPKKIIFLVAILLLTALGGGLWFSTYSKNTSADKAMAQTTARLRTQAKAVAVKAAEEAQAVAAKAAEEATAAEEAKAAEEAQAAEEAKAAQAASSTPRARKRGGPPVDIKLFSAPLGIQVLVDGKSIGKTPKKLTIASGAHTVTFIDGGKKIRKSINVTSGGKSKWTYKQASGSVN